MKHICVYVASSFQADSVARQGIYCCLIAWKDVWIELTVTCSVPKSHISCSSAELVVFRSFVQNFTNKKKRFLTNNLHSVTLFAVSNCGTNSTFSRLHHRLTPPLQMSQNWHRFQWKWRKRLTRLWQGTAGPAAVWPPASFRWENSDLEMFIWGVNAGSNAEPALFFVPTTIIQFFSEKNKGCLLCISAWNCSTRHKEYALLIKWIGNLCTGPVLHIHLPPPASRDAASRKTNKQTKKRSRFGAATVCHDCRGCFAFARSLTISRDVIFGTVATITEDQRCGFYEAGRTKFALVFVRCCCQ